jgi:hypothetical protein
MTSSVFMWCITACVPSLRWSPGAVVLAWPDGSDDVDKIPGLVEVIRSSSSSSSDDMAAVRAWLVAPPSAATVTHR